MHWTSLGVAITVTMLGGCALIYGYGDYKDDATGGGGANASSTSSGMGGTAGSGGTPGDGSCLVNEACPLSSDPCKLRICLNGSCTTVVPDISKPVSRLPLGDCRSFFCDASGTQVELLDATDVPDDANDCTADLCVNGVPQNPSHSSNALCGESGSGFVCDGNGKCTGCMASGAFCGPDPPSGNALCKDYACSSNACAATNKPDAGDCGSYCVNWYRVTKECQGGACLTTSVTPCLNGNTCLDSVACNAGGCAPGPACAPGYYCFTDGNECLPCTKCAQWAADPVDPPMPILCPESTALVQGVKTCACTAACPDCQSTKLCGSSDPVNFACASCVFSTCAAPRQLCQLDQVPELPSPLNL